jgi:hypothetical protein
MLAGKIGYFQATAHPEAADWRSRVIANGGTVSASTFAAVETFCRAVDTAGIRSRLFRVNLFCGTGLASALVPLYRGQSLGGTQFGGTTDTNVNLVSGDYTETGTSGGLRAGSTKYLNTGFLPVTAGLTPFDSHMSFYSRSQVTTNTTILGSFGGNTNQATYQMLGFGGISLLYYRSGGGSNSGIEAATWSGANRAGHIVCVRTASNAAKAYRNGSDLGLSATVSNTNTWTPGVPPAVYVFGRNNVGTADQLGFTGALQSYSLGQALTDSQASAFSSAMIALQAALTRN